MSTGNGALPEVLDINAVGMDGRIRSDLGNIADLITSIRENTLIQPVVIARDSSGTAFTLVAGGRRMTALKALGVKELRHGREFVWRDEITDGPAEARLRLQAIELEENLRRKELSWPEQVLGKQRLLKIMQEIHGVAETGGRTREELRTGQSSGFGVRKLAAMLGESPAQTSKDLQLATAVSKLPQLRNQPSKDGAMKTVIGILAQALGKANPMAKAVAPVKPLEYRVMIYCDSEQQQAELLLELQSRGLKCQSVIV